MSTKEILAFSHIPKTAGTTLTQILKRNFGPRHLSVEFRTPPPNYRAENLKLDLRINPFIESISGHTLKPFVDFGAADNRLIWYTFVRNPVERFISHYQHQYYSGIEKYRLPFHEWSRTYERHNWMVRMIAGKEDLDLAIKTLRGKFTFVGLTEKFDVSLLLFRSAVDRPHLNIDYPQPSNISPKSGLRDRIICEIDQYMDEILVNNELDIKLYDYVRYELFEEQVERYGREKLMADHRRVFKRAPVPLAEKTRMSLSDLYRHTVYKPLIWLDKRFQAHLAR